MKPLSETLTELGIAFRFPIKIYDAKGNETYFEDSNGFWYTYKYDAYGYETYYEASNGYWQRCERDANGYRTYYENSIGVSEAHLSQLGPSVGS